MTISLFCAICARDVPLLEARSAPLGRNGATVTICRGCDDEPARSYTSERPTYELREGMSGVMMRAAGDRVLRELGAPVQTRHTVNERHVVGRNIHDRTPGWILIRISIRHCDVREAIARLRREPWFRDVRFLGSVNRWHLFERPDPKVAAEQRQRSSGVDPIEWLEKYKTEIEKL